MKYTKHFNINITDDQVDHLYHLQTVFEYDKQV